MYRNWTTANLTAELQEIARELRIADPGDKSGLLARFARVEAALTDRCWYEARMAAQEARYVAA